MSINSLGRPPVSLLAFIFAPQFASEIEEAAPPPPVAEVASRTAHRLMSVDPETHEPSVETQSPPEIGGKTESENITQPEGPVVQQVADCLKEAGYGVYPMFDLAFVFHQGAWSMLSLRGTADLPYLALLSLPANPAPSQIYALPPHTDFSGSSYDSGWVCKSILASHPS